jgi:hypothetical protein
MEAMVLASSLIRKRNQDEKMGVPQPISDPYALPRSGIASVAVALLGTGIFALVLDALAR